MKSEFMILNNEMEQLTNEISDELNLVSKHLDECEGMEDMKDKTKEIIDKLDRIKWISNYMNKLWKNVEK
jgi:hypothetical protein